MDLASGELLTAGEMEGRAKKAQKFDPPRRTRELERLALCVCGRRKTPFWSMESTQPSRTGRTRRPVWSMR
jgi:hypothetical protein